MDFLLIDLYDTTIEGTKFNVVVLYEQVSHTSTKVYFRSNEKADEKLRAFFNDYAYTIVTPYVKYKMANSGKISLQLSI